MLERVSADGQIYFRCAACGLEYRVDLIVNSTAEKLDKARRQKCRGCGKNRLDFVQHVLRVSVSCPDCGTVSPVDWQHDTDVHCPVCASDRVVPVAESFEPPFPPECGEFDPPIAWRPPGGAPEHVWGRSGVEDATRIRHEENLTEQLPDSHREHYRLILFAQRLRRTSAYADAEGRYLMANITANLSQAYLRATGDALVGAAALDDFQEMIDLAPNEPTMAMAQHSYAMGVYSMLARFPEKYVEAAAERPGIRRAAIDVARAAEQTLTKYLDHDPERMAAQRARVRFVIGDLLRVGDTDDDQRREAVTYFGAALTDPWVAENLGFGVAEARAHAIMQLTDPDKELLTQAMTDLELAVTTAGRDETYSGRWRWFVYLAHLELRDSRERDAGLQWLEYAAALALQQFSALGDELQLVYQAESLVHVFELLATRYTDLGWNDEALSAVEIMRGSAIRLYSMIDEERDAFLAEIRARHLEDLWPAVLKTADVPPLGRQVSMRPIDEYIEDDPIGPPMKALLRRHDDIPTAFLCVFVTEVNSEDPIVSALLCHMTGEDEWANVRRQWRSAAADLAPLYVQRYSEPGPFRERLLDKTCVRGAKTLLAPLDAMIKESGAERLIVSMPGALSRLPLEAFPAGDGVNPLAVTYLPSARFGADLVHGMGSSTHDLRDARVLALGYDGDDIPAQKAELDNLRDIWGSQLTLVPGEQCTKDIALQAMAQPYDIIHIVCHGTFDDTRPLESALHFCADAHNAVRRVSARDLLAGVRFPNNPLVILSACSSIIVADSRTNSFHGLAGSLFRIGARAIVGSRWPVDDHAASVLMTRFHHNLRNTDLPPDLSLRDACRQLREDGYPTEHWASFGFLGII
jgi:DNA-directed RNA polymerase subunit RPC12/RpoP